MSVKRVDEAESIVCGIFFGRCLEGRKNWIGKGSVFKFFDSITLSFRSITNLASWIKSHADEAIDAHFVANGKLDGSMIVRCGRVRHVKFDHRLEFAAD